MMYLLFPVEVSKKKKKKKLPFSKNYSSSSWTKEVSSPKYTLMLSYIKCYMLNELTVLVFTAAFQVNGYIPFLYNMQIYRWHHISLLFLLKY